MSGQTRIRVWRNGHRMTDGTEGRWFWHWKAANGLLVGQQAQGNGYSYKRDCIAGMETITGGTFTETFRSRRPDGRAYIQGELIRLRREVTPWGSVGFEESIFVEVLS